MRVNLHKSQKYFYLCFFEEDSLRKISLFEDMDETVFNFNLDSKKRPIKNKLKEEFLEKSNYSVPSSVPSGLLTKNFFKSYF